METERGTNPATGEDASTAAGQGGVLGKTETGLDRAGAFVKAAVNKTRNKVGEYREKGMEQVSQDVVGYTRSQPLTALLIATATGLLLGMLLALDKRK